MDTMRTTLVDVLARHLWTVQLSTRNCADWLEWVLWEVAQETGVMDAVVATLEQTEARYLHACEYAVRRERRRLMQREASDARNP